MCMTSPQATMVARICTWATRTSTHESSNGTFSPRGKHSIRSPYNTSIVKVSNKRTLCVCICVYVCDSASFFLASEHLARNLLELPGTWRWSTRTNSIDQLPSDWSHSWLRVASAIEPPLVAVGLKDSWNLPAAIIISAMFVSQFFLDSRQSQMRYKLSHVLFGELPIYLECTNL